MEQAIDTLTKRLDDVIDHLQKIQQGTNRGSVHVDDISMPFGSMVVFMLKWAIAAIPAAAILAVSGAFLVGFLSRLNVG